MATANAPTTLERAQNFATDWANSSLVVKEGSTTLATFAVASWTAQNVGNDGRAVSSNPADVNASETGTADTVELVNGSKVYTLTIGTDVTLNTTSFVSGETASAGVITVLFRASAV